MLPDSTSNTTARVTSFSALFSVCLRQDVERLHERQTGVDHRRELPREDHDVAHLDRPRFFDAAAACRLRRSRTLTGISRCRRSCAMTSSAARRVERRRSGARPSAGCAPYTSKCWHPLAPSSLAITARVRCCWPPLPAAVRYLRPPGFFAASSSGYCRSCAGTRSGRGDTRRHSSCATSRFMYSWYSASFIVCMPNFLPDCIERVDLVDLVVADQRADRRRARPGSRAAIARPRPCALGSSVCVTTPSSTNASCARTCDCWCAREDVDDAVDRLGRRVGVQRGERKVTGLGDRERRLDRLQVAHFTDEDDVGVLAQRVLERGREALRVGARLRAG